MNSCVTFPGSTFQCDALTLAHEHLHDFRIAF